MEPYTYDQLKAMKVAQLREIADGIEHELLHGHSTMHKEQLLPALCKALNVHIARAASGADKPGIKATLRKLRTQRDEALAAGDHARLKVVRHQIHSLKHRLRRMVKRGS